MNKVILLGRLTRDPDVRYTANNTCVCQFAIAVNRRYAKEGEQQADFINVVAWAKTAEFISKYFVKGQQIALNGRIQTRSYDDKEGKKVYVTEVVAEEVYFADSKKDNTNSFEAGFNAQASTEFIPTENPKELPF